MRTAATSAIRASRGTALRAFASKGGFLGDLAGKVVVVGGAGNPPSEAFGMGSTTALMFARAGAKVVSVAHLSENCDTVTEAITSEGFEVRLRSFSCAALHLRMRCATRRARAFGLTSRCRGRAREANSACALRTPPRCACRVFADRTSTLRLLLPFPSPSARPAPWAPP